MYKEQTLHSIFHDKEYRSNYASEYSNMEKDISDGKFNLTMEDYVRVYRKQITVEKCNELMCDIKSYPKEYKFSGDLSNLVRKGTFLNTHMQENPFVRKIESFVEEQIKILSKKYTEDVRPLHYAYGGRFNHYDYQVIKYTPEDYFRLHHDHYAETLNNSRLLTVCIYLNDDYEGGELDFPSAGINKEYTFDVGDAIVFPSNWMFYHGVKPITSGERYVVVIWMGIDLSHTAITMFSK